MGESQCPTLSQLGQCHVLRSINSNTHLQVSISMSANVKCLQETSFGIKGMYWKAMGKARMELNAEQSSRMSAKAG